MDEVKNYYEEIYLNDEKETILVKFNDNSIETNEITNWVDDTIELSGVVKEINDDE